MRLWLWNPHTGISKGETDGVIKEDVANVEFGVNRKYGSFI